jgi:cell shape-determining protein MreC
VGFSTEKQEDKQKLPKPKKWSEEHNGKMIEIAVEKPNSTYSDLMKEFSGRTQQLLLPKFKKAKDEVLTKRRIDRIKELEEENEGLMQEDKVLKEKLSTKEAKHYKKFPF